MKPIVNKPKTKHKYFIIFILLISFFSKIPFFNLLNPAESMLLFVKTLDGAELGLLINSLLFKLLLLLF